MEGSILNARSDLEDWKERASWSRRMAIKGLMSKVQADADANRVDAATITLSKCEEQKRVLVDYTYKRTVQDFTAEKSEADHNLEKSQLKNKSTLAQDAANRNAARSVFDQEVVKQKDIEDQITKCQVYAPQDGLVIYFVPEQVKGGGGGVQQSIVSQGEPVPRRPEDDAHPRFDAHARQRTASPRPLFLICTTN